MTAAALPAVEDHQDRSDRSASTAGLGRSSVVLAASGLLLCAVYAIATARVPLARYFPEAGITVDFVKMLGPGWERPTVEYVDVVLITFALYLVALAAVWRTRAHIPRWLLFGMPAAFALILLSMYPPTAVDMFHYQASSRVLWVHGENPLTVPPGDFPYPIGYSWAGQPAPYGPLWPVIAGPAVLLTGDHYLAGLYAFKLIAAASYLGCTVMIWRLVARTRPGQETLAVVLFAWNPFVVLRVVGNGHNDLVMMFFLLLAFELALRRHWNYAFLAFACSALVKYVSLLLGPPLLIYLLFHATGTPRQRVATAIEALAIAAIVVIVVFAPLWEGLATFDTVRGEADKVITSTPLLIGLLISGAPEDPATVEAVRGVLRVLFVGLYLLLAWQARRSFDHLVVASFTILFLHLLVPTGWFRPWYMLWPVTLAALRPRSWLAAVLLAITFACCFPDLIEQYRNNWSFLADYTKAIAAPIVVAFVPPALVWLAGAAWARSWTLGTVGPGREHADALARSTH
ncbi:MAG: glycosyltransferase 87 family protein [Dehalococcoidia bacterium]